MHSFCYINFINTTKETSRSQVQYVSIHPEFLLRLRGPIFRSVATCVCHGPKIKGTTSGFIYNDGGATCRNFMKWPPFYQGKKRGPYRQITLPTKLTMAAAAWDSNDVSSIIRIIFLKEESAWSAGRSRKEELIRNSIPDCKFI